MSRIAGFEAVMKETLIPDREYNQDEKKGWIHEIELTEIKKGVDKDNKVLTAIIAVIHFHKENNLVKVQQKVNPVSMIKRYIPHVIVTVNMTLVPIY